MSYMILYVGLLFLPTLIFARNDDKDTAARTWLKEYTAELTLLQIEAEKAGWAHNTNITDEHEKESLHADLKLSHFSIRSSNYAYKNFNPLNIKDPSLKRQILIVIRDRSATTDSERKQIEKIKADLARMYNTAKICPIENPHNCTESEMLGLFPDILTIMSDSRNETVLRYVWEAWREATGPKMGATYINAILNSSKDVKRMGFKSLAEQSLIRYTEDEPSFRTNLKHLFKEILPFYEDLHAFARYRLNKHYGSETVKLNTTIPAHLLASMWAGKWSSLIDLLRPYPNIKRTDVSVDNRMKSLNWTVTKMFVTAENFFKSLGMPPLEQQFWNFSMLEKPNDGRKVACFASAWDLQTQKDFRIKMCTRITKNDLGTVHHELGHIYYYKAYKDLPILFRTGANDGFHEAIGDMIYLSSNTDSYLQKIGLLPSNYKPSKEEQINTLMEKALDSITVLPLTYLADKWRWDIEEENLTENTANTHWWNLRKQYQGVHPPVGREPRHMDPMSIFHIVKFIPLIRYYVAMFLQYQFHESACKEEYSSIPTYKCSIFGSKKAGQKLWKILQRGGSTPWPEVLKMMTGGKQMSAKPILNYFEEIARWLRRSNKANKVCLGWGTKWPADFKLNEPRCI